MQDLDTGVQIEWCLLAVAALQREATRLRREGRVSEELDDAFKVTSGALLHALLHPAAQHVGSEITLRIAGE